MTSRLRASLSPLSLGVAVLALVVSGAGIGYTAATVGTDDLQNNAVTSKKVKNGSLKAADLVKEKKLTVPTLNNGTQGDCLWTDGEDQIPGIFPVGYRKDRFGTTHLTGIALPVDGAGGDAACGGMDTPDALDDYTMFTLPAKAMPAAGLYINDAATSSLLVIPGPDGLDLGGGTVIPPGAVLCSSSGSACWLEGISFPTTSAKVVSRSSAPLKKITPTGRKLLKQLLR
jgi:hypothetical protein